MAMNKKQAKRLAALNIGNGILAELRNNGGGEMWTTDEAGNPLSKAAAAKVRLHAEDMVNRLLKKHAGDDVVSPSPRPALALVGTNP